MLAAVGGILLAPDRRRDGAPARRGHRRRRPVRRRAAVRRRAGSSGRQIGDAELSARDRATRSAGHGRPAQHRPLDRGLRHRHRGRGDGHGPAVHPARGLARGPRLVRAAAARRPRARSLLAALGSLVSVLLVAGPDRELEVAHPGGRALDRLPRRHRGAAGSCGRSRRRRRPTPGPLAAHRHRRRRAGRRPRARRRPAFVADVARAPRATPRRRRAALQRRRRRCATCRSTRSPSPAPTTRCRRRCTRAGCSPSRSARSAASSTRACGRSSSTPTTACRPRAGCPGRARRSCSPTGRPSCARHRARTVDPDVGRARVAGWRRGRNAPPTPSRDIYLCHNYCELGAVAFSSVLERRRDLPRHATPTRS